MSKRNEAIGRVECPCKGCSEQCDVFRFKERGESEKSIANRRFAGKLYGRCSKHGRFGGDAGDPDMQEYILCNAKMNAPSAGDRQPAPAKISPRAPAKVPQKPAPAAAPPRSSPVKAPAAPVTVEGKSVTWGFFE